MNTQEIRHILLALEARIALLEQRERALAERQHDLADLMNDLKLKTDWLWKDRQGGRHE